MSYRIAAIINRTSGTLRDADHVAFGEHLIAAFASHGHIVDLHFESGAGLGKAMGRAALSDAVDVLLAVGGDGTVSAAAGLAWKNGKVLAVLPGGTMNLFARSIRMPLELDAAVDALAAGTVRPIDIATANGRPFLHQFAVGIHPRMIRLRNKLDYASRWGKIVASAKAGLSITRNPPVFEAELRLDGGPPERRKLSAISVSAAPFADGHLPYADILDSGKFGVYTAVPISPGRAIRLAKDVLLGTWSRNDDINSRTAQCGRSHIHETAPQGHRHRGRGDHRPRRAGAHPKSPRCIVRDVPDNRNGMILGQ